MIIYQMKKPIECYDTDCVGVTGDNIAYTQEFYIKGVSDDSISFTLHLRFADGSVNSITPDIVIPDGEGTEIRWIVKKNDIFKHGYFELQIEGRNRIGLVFQTEIVRLYADESLPVEDREYENPNSETIKLREEAYAALEEIKNQQAQIEENVKKIEQTDLNNKADKATTLAGYGITDGENTKNKISDKSKITDDFANYPSICYLNEYYYDFNEVDEALSGKLDNTAGSVTTDNIASKSVTSDKIAAGAITALKIATNAVSGSNIAQYQISANHLQSGAVTTDKLADEVKESINSKADKATTLDGYGITDGENTSNKTSYRSRITDEYANYPTISYLNEYYYDFNDVDNELAAKSDLVQSKNIFDFDTWAKGLQNLKKPIYNGTLDVVDFDEKSITFTSTGTSTFTNGWVDEPAEMRIAVKSNTVYTFSWLFENSTNNRIFLFFNGQNTAETSLTEVGSKAFLTFTTPEDASYITIRFDSYNQNIAAKVSNIMLEEGDKKSLYLPYEVAEGVKELAKSTETAISDMTGNTDTALEAKYDASNVETGLGTLTPYTSSTDIVKSADFTYQRVGRVVTVNVNIVFNEGTNSQVMFTNLPYVCKNTVNPRELCVSTAKTTRIWAINKNNTMLNIFSDSSVSYADGETLAFTLSYLIS